MTVKKILDILNGIAPVDTACAWDNCGLLAGNGNAEVTGVYVTLDADLYALERAKQNGCNLVVSHHPVIFDAMKSVTDTDVVFEYITNGVAVISMHTCLDIARGGVNDALANAIGLTDIQPVFLDGEPLARIGDTGAKDTDEFIDICKRATDSERADCVLINAVKRVMTVSGSGGSALDTAKALGADTLVTGEAKHSDFVKAHNIGINLITLGHFETENLIIPTLCEIISGYVKTVADDRKQIVTRR